VYTKCTKALTFENLFAGVKFEDMGKKTVGNDLDNAAIGFDNVKLRKEALLNRFADIDGEEYVQKVQGMPVFHMIGQRLFTGRVAVAQAALEFRRGLFEMTKKYTDKKPCWAPTGEPVLSHIPQLKAIFAENERKLNFLDSFVGKCEAELSANLKANKLPSIQLVEAIAVAKVKAVEESIEISHRLQNEVGSYALMAGTGFEQKDFLTCCKFAEGDSRILMQKMSRDRLKVFEKKQASEDPKTWDAETKLCAELASKIAADAKKCGDKQQVRSFVSAVYLERGRPETHQNLERVSACHCTRLSALTRSLPPSLPLLPRVQAWDDNWEGIYALSEVIMQNTISKYMAS
jgi:acyl-CoA oxidase